MKPESFTIIRSFFHCRNKYVLPASLFILLSRTFRCRLVCMCLLYAHRGNLGVWLSIISLLRVTTSAPHGYFRVPQLAPRSTTVYPRMSSKFSRTTTAVHSSPKKNTSLVVGDDFAVGRREGMEVRGEGVRHSGVARGIWEKAKQETRVEAKQSTREGSVHRARSPQERGIIQVRLL